jgi:hypothetical protein
MGLIDDRSSLIVQLPEGPRDYSCNALRNCRVGVCGRRFHSFRGDMINAQCR